MIEHARSVPRNVKCHKSATRELGALAVGVHRTGFSDRWRVRVHRDQAILTVADV